MEVALTLLSRLRRLIAIFDLSALTSTNGDEGGAIARIADGTRGTEDDVWDPMNLRKIRQISFEAVMSRASKTHLRSYVVHHHPSLPIEHV